MRQIATELVWSPTTAYRYFKRKNEILAVEFFGSGTLDVSKFHC